MNSGLRQQLCDTARAMNASGINQGTAGNLSVRTPHGMLITPSGKDCATLSAEQIVMVEHSGSWSGPSPPSSEWRIHYDIYQQRADARAIVHAHPMFCTTLACLGRPIPAFHYMVAIAGGRDIRCAEYATFGTQELSDNVVLALQGRTACLMANHGLLCLRDDLPGCLALAIEVEQLAQAYYQCLSVGQPQILDDQEMDKVLKKFVTYGA